MRALVAVVALFVLIWQGFAFDVHIGWMVVAALVLVGTSPESIELQRTEIETDEHGYVTRHVGHTAEDHKTVRPEDVR